jgi:uncharacterized Rmd1/YagE family protein
MHIIMVGATSFALALIRLLTQANTQTITRSQVLDAPELFWSEPALEPRYMAIRNYIEILRRMLSLEMTHYCVVGGIILM